MLTLSQKEEEEMVKEEGGWSECVLEEEKVSAHAAERERRVERFVGFVRDRKQQYIESFFPAV